MTHGKIITGAEPSVFSNFTRRPVSLGTGGKILNVNEKHLITYLLAPIFPA